MKDLISRQAAIDAMKELCEHYTPTKSVTHPHIDFVIEQLMWLPSAQPEQKCETCRYRNLEWSEEPCDSCTMGGGDCHYKSERKKGKWIDYTEDGFVECPYCHSATNCDGNKAELHFCFSCGADMRGEQDDKCDV